MIRFLNKSVTPKERKQKQPQHVMDGIKRPLAETIEATYFVMGPLFFKPNPLCAFEE